MKIALLGNMNNNNFSLMRYFVSVGVEADLILFKNESNAKTNHFHPIHDTFEFNQWEKHIKYIPVDNDWRGLIQNMSFLGIRSKRSVVFREILEDYTCIIGSGLTPSLLHLINKRLTVFYPYATGIEYVGSRPVRLTLQEKKWSLKKMATYTIRRIQIIGIRKSYKCFNSELSLTKTTFEELDIKFKNLQIPMVYNEAINSIEDKELQSIINRINKSKFSILSHSRHFWLNDEGHTNEEWSKRSKNNDWLIKGFASFVKLKEPSAILVLFKYGKDYNLSQQLVQDLGIEDNVIWVGKIPRKRILYLLRRVHVGVGEFSIERNAIWGGTGWEVLCCGRPLLQSFNFTIKEFQQSFGTEPPPILDVKNQNDIIKHLTNLNHDISKVDQIGELSKQWYDKYHGIELAKRWLLELTKVNE